MQTNEHRIEIEKTANIQRASFVVRPGVNVLRGRNGAGKSEALSAVQAALTGDASGLEVTRGTAEDERGIVKAFGVTMTLNRRREDIASDPDRGRARITGSLEVQALTGLDPLDLISPRGESIEVRDGKRMAALCRMLRITTDLERFGEAAKYASPPTRRAADLPEMASKLKRDVQAFARDVELRAAKVAGEVKAHLNSAGDVSDEPADLVDWAGRAQELALELRDLETRKRASVAAQSAAVDARKQLEQARANYDGPTHAAALTAVSDCELRVTELRTALRDEEARLKLLRQMAETASRHENAMTMWQHSIEDGERAVAVDDAEIDRVKTAIAEANTKVANAAVDAERRRHRNQAKALLEDSNSLEAEARRLREVADGVEGVLTEAINAAANCGLKVENGRLISTEYGDAYDRLSHGQRAKIAVGIIARAFPQGRAVAVIPQEAGEAIDHANMEELDRIAREHDVVILTAAHDDGELRAEFFSATLN